MANYRFIELPNLIRMAKMAGQDSIYDSILVEWVMRSRLGEMPACIRDCDASNAEDGFIVIDMQNIPEELPLEIKMECAIAVNLINEKRRKTYGEPVKSWQAPTTSQPEPSMSMSM